MVSPSRGLLSIVLNPMIDLNKLNSQLSTIKDMDVAQLIAIAKEHQNSLIKFALIVGSLLMVGRMFNDHRIQGQLLRVQMSQAQEKLEVLKARDATIRDLDDFKSSLPKKLNELELISLISNYAEAQHITIASLSPAESKDMGLYDVISLSFSATADHFKELILFLRKIEKSNFPLRVDSWSGYETDQGKITFAIVISAVLIHP